MKCLPRPFFGEGSFLHDAFVQAHPDRNPDDGIFMQLAELVEDPRIIKTHLPFSLLSPSLPNTSKVRDSYLEYSIYFDIIRQLNLKYIFFAMFYACLTENIINN